MDIIFGSCIQFKILANGGGSSFLSAGIFFDDWCTLIDSLIYPGYAVIGPIIYEWHK